MNMKSAKAAVERGAEGSARLRTVPTPPRVARPLWPTYRNSFRYLLPWIALMTIALLTPAVLSSRALADTARSRTQWTVQVANISPGNVEIGPAFQMAIYENLLHELAKSEQFRQVLRCGDRNAVAFPDLLILKTTVESYTEGSETRRATTTFGGATKLRVRSELQTRDGQIILEREFNGNVRFFGDNLRATHNLARNVANAIKHSDLPEPSATVPNGQHRNSTA